jgi:hypothetical protein
VSPARAASPRRPALSSERLAKLDASGKPLWVQSHRQGSFSRLSSVALDAKDEIVGSGVSEHGLFLRRVSPDGEPIWSRDFEASKVGNLRALPDGEDRLLLVGEASAAQFGPDWTSQEGSVFLVELGL